MSNWRELPAGRELDALVAEKVMGLKVVGRCCAVFVEGEWSIHPDAEPEGWTCYAELAPVYARPECDCAESVVREYDTPEKAELYREIDAERDARQAISMAKTGHRTYCLGVVPGYSTDIAAAWEVVEKLLETCFVDVNAIPGSSIIQWFVTVRLMPLTARHPIRGAGALTAPLAICLAALAALETP
jgi:hypothetical protein